MRSLLVYYAVRERESPLKIIDTLSLAVTLLLPHGRSVGDVRGRIWSTENKEEEEGIAEWGGGDYTIAVAGGVRL